MSTKENPNQYKIAKSKVENEQEALKNACEKLERSDRYLKAEHTIKTFVFTKIR